MPQHKIIQLFPLFLKRFPFFHWQMQTQLKASLLPSWANSIKAALVGKTKNAEHRAHQTLKNKSSELPRWCWQSSTRFLAGSLGQGQQTLSKFTNNRNQLPGSAGPGRASPVSQQCSRILCWEWKQSLTKWVQSLPAAFFCCWVLLGRAENMARESDWAKSMKIEWMQKTCCPWVGKLLLHLLVVCSQAERENLNERPNEGRQGFSPTKMG